MEQAEALGNEIVDGGAKLAVTPRIESGAEGGLEIVPVTNDGDAIGEDGGAAPVGNCLPEFLPLEFIRRRPGRGRDLLDVEAMEDVIGGLSMNNPGPIARPLKVERDWEQLQAGAIFQLHPLGLRGFPRAGHAHEKIRAAVRPSAHYLYP
jgi:hypothetical protein